jgi:hypothetical protein
MVAGLDPAAAPAAATDVDVVADSQRAGFGEILDMLGSDLFQDQLAAAAGAAPREPDRYDLVDVLGWLPVRMPAVSRARPAAGTLGITRGVVPGERGGLALGGSAQRLHLGAQALVGLPQPLALGPQPPVLPTQPLAFGLQALLLVTQRRVLVLEVGDALVQRRPAGQLPDGDPTHRHRRHKTRRLQPARPPSTACSLTCSARRWRATAAWRPTSSGQHEHEERLKALAVGSCWRPPVGAARPDRRTRPRTPSGKYLPAWKVCRMVSEQESTVALGKEHAMNEHPRPDDAAHALTEIRHHQQQVIDLAVLPTWYWWTIAALTVILAAGVDTNTPTAIGTTVAVFVLGILAATGWALAGTLRHAPLRNGLLDHRGVAAILGFVALTVGLTLGLAFTLQATGLSHPATLAAAVGGLGMGIGGPILMRRLHRNMLANRAGSPQ